MRYFVKNRPKRLLILTQSSFERPLSKLSNVIGPTELKLWLARSKMLYLMLM